MKALLLGSSRFILVMFLLPFSRRTSMTTSLNMHAPASPCHWVVPLLLSWGQDNVKLVFFMCHQSAYWFNKTFVAMWPGQSTSRLNRSVNHIVYLSYLCLFIYSSFTLLCYLTALCGSFTVLCYLTALCVTITWCDSSFLHLSYVIR